MKYDTAKKMADWFDKNKRSLPWRDTNNPYDVWLSEIMLQQTRIEAVKPKYELFKQELPEISLLAECDDDRLMRLWEGLGYYSRARNLKKCAQVIIGKYNGKLPQQYNELIDLPGIGPYTAGAIASIAYGNPAPAVDGNVMRVISRLLELKEDVRNPSFKKEIEQTIMDIFSYDASPSFVSSFNQSIMELGEVICIPNGKAKCDLCPCKDDCLAHLHNTKDTIPYRSPLNKRKIIQRTLLIIRDGDLFLIHKRKETGLLANLYEFIGIDEKLKTPDIIQLLEEKQMEPLHIKKLPDSKHIFTHLEWHMQAYEIQVAQIEKYLQNDYMLLSKTDLATRAIPSAFKKYIDYYTLRE